MEKKIDLIEIRDSARKALNEYSGKYSDLCRKTGLERNWLRKFRDGDFPNVGVETLNKLVAGLAEGA